LEIVGGKRVEPIGGFFFLIFNFFLVVASYSSNEIVVTNRGVLGAFVASMFGH
jgi:hypothetical protein